MEQLSFLWEAIKWMSVWFIIISSGCYFSCAVFVFIRATHYFLYKRFVPYQILIDIAGD